MARISAVELCREIQKRGKWTRAVCENCRKNKKTGCSMLPSGSKVPEKPQVRPSCFDDYGEDSTLISRKA